MRLPKSLQNVVDSFESLPGVGPKTAQRLAFYLLRVPKTDVENFANSLQELKEKTVICSKCFNVGDSEFCEVCNDDSRDQNTICVVESPLDVLAIERSDYRGVYHVLHGVINPISGVGPDEIFAGQLIDRVGKLLKDSEADELYSGTGSFNRNDEDDIQANNNAINNAYISNVKKVPSRVEIILATSTSLEGETTSMYLHREFNKQYGNLIRVSRIGKGLPVGAEIEYSDDRTIMDALESRIQY